MSNNDEELQNEVDLARDRILNGVQEDVFNIDENVLEMDEEFIEDEPRN